MTSLVIFTSVVLRSFLINHRKKNWFLTRDAKLNAGVWNVEIQVSVFHTFSKFTINPFFQIVKYS